MGRYLSRWALEWGWHVATGSKLQTNSLSSAPVWSKQGIRFPLVEDPVLPGCWSFDFLSTNKTLERYQRCCYNPQDANISDRETQGWYQEVSKLKAKCESLQRSQRHLLGEDLGPLSVKELQQLERQLEVALSKARQRKTQIMMEQMEELRKKERQLGDINKQLKNKLEAEGAFRGLQGSWESGAVVGNSTFSLHPSQSGPMDCEPTLQIGYHPHFVPSEAAIPRTVAGESNFIQGWVL